VYEAYHEIFKGPCYQKTVPLAGMPDAMMLTEPQLLASLEHDHIVRIREAQFDPVDPTMVTYVMPNYEGGSVEKHLFSGGTFTIGQALGVAGHLLDALSYFHVDVGFVHRDVKPGNALLDAAQRTGYLSDFGSAARLTTSGTVRLAGFTLPYVDPAAFVGGGMTVASDVFGVGMTLFEMLSGTLLLRFNAAKATARLAKGQRAYPDSAFVYAPHVPQTVRRLVNKSIAADATRRFSTAAEMATAVAKAGRSVIDWARISGSGLNGEWHGTWPPSKPLAKRRRYRVESSVLTTGRNAGERRLEAYCDTGMGWRRFGGLVEVVDAADASTVSKFLQSRRCGSPQQSRSINSGRTLGLHGHHLPAGRYGPLGGNNEAPGSFETWFDPAQPHGFDHGISQLRDADAGVIDQARAISPRQSLIGRRPDQRHVQWPGHIQVVCAASITSCHHREEIRQTINKHLFISWETIGG
jgi:serine/threonine protein kinase